MGGWLGKIIYQDNFHQWLGMVGTLVVFGILALFSLGFLLSDNLLSDLSKRVRDAREEWSSGAEERKKAREERKRIQEANRQANQARHKALEEKARAQAESEEANRKTTAAPDNGTRRLGPALPRKEKRI